MQKKGEKNTQVKKSINKKPEVAFEKTMESVKTKFGLKNILQAKEA